MGSTDRRFFKNDKIGFTTDHIASARQEMQRATFARRRVTTKERAAKGSNRVRVGLIQGEDGISEQVVEQDSWQKRELSWMSQRPQMTISRMGLGQFQLGPEIWPPMLFGSSFLIAVERK